MMTKDLPLFKGKRSGLTEFRLPTTTVSKYVSKQLLPKQIGLTKLLRSQNINNIMRIKYKSPYKVLITFSTKEDSERLLSCEKFSELEYRCFNTNQGNIVYGVIKGIKLELDDKEIMEIFQGESEIISVRRLRRLNENGVLSVRLGFKGSTLPSNILGYGCRFKVEPYHFPVSQCSGCWKFGHLIFGCPYKKIKCPKCGSSDHKNCATKEFICINCKGPHLALDKKCSIRIKEKKLRDIMYLKNLTYKQALEVYRQQKAKADNPSLKEHEQNIYFQEPGLNKSDTIGNRSYKDVFIGKPEICISLASSERFATLSMLFDHFPV